MAAEDERDRTELLAELLADHAARHSRPATASERVPLENIAIGTIRIRRLESQGRSSFEERKQLAQWWRAAGLKVDKLEPKTAADRVAAFQAEMQARYSKPPVAQTDVAAQEQPGDEGPLSGATTGHGGASP
jgi:hypothetical protein